MKNAILNIVCLGVDSVKAKYDFSKVKKAVSLAAGKVINMKTSHKIIIGAATAVTAATAGTAIVKSNQAKKQGRSVKSLMFEDAARRLPVTPKRQKSYEAALEESAKPFVLPNPARKIIGLTELDAFTDTFVLEPKDKTSDDIIFYIPGSNYWYHPSRYHYAFMRKAVNQLGMQMIVPVYPKAPTHNVVEIQQMILDRYLYLINEKEIPAENIVFMGDAAGGAIALALLQKLRYQALPMPKLGILISPWLDATLANPDIEQYIAQDSLLSPDKLAYKAEHYAGDLPLTHPAVSPIYGDLSGLPRLLVFAGSREIFCADVLKLQQFADEHELDIDVNVFQSQMHFFVGLPIPEAEEAFAIMSSELYGVEEVDVLPDEIEEDEEVLEEVEEPLAQTTQLAEDFAEATVEEEDMFTE